MFTKRTKYFVARVFKSPSGKTEVATIVSMHCGAEIGQVKWHARWRRYALFPAADTLWDAECLREVGELISLMTTRWKESKKQA